MKEEWLFPGAVVPVDVETTSALVAEIKRLIDVVGGMALTQRPWVGLTDEEVNSTYETIEKVVGDHWENGGTKLMFPVTLYEALEAKLREKNS